MAQGTTLVELVVAVAILTVVFTAVLPVIRHVRNSWDGQQGAADTIQNGRVLTDHLHHNLSEAVRITAVSDADESDGYIEFQDNAGDTLRYELSSGYVQFGEVGNLSQLAGPCTQLQFTCYDIEDLDTATTDPNSIRFVRIDMTLTNSAAMGQDKSFEASAYLRCHYSVLTQNLVGHWKLDETSGTTAADSSGGGYHGTLTNMSGSEWTNGVVGGALELNGGNDYVDLPIDSLITTLTDCTVTAWVKWDGSGGYWQRIFDFGNGTSKNMFLTCNNQYNGKPRFAITDTGYWDEDQVDASSTLNTEWHHFAVTIDDENTTHKMYIDGVVVGQNTSTRFNPTDLGTMNYNWLGRSQYSADAYYNGTLDDVRLYGRVLDADEVAAIADILRYVDGSETKVASDSTSVTISTPSTNTGDLLIAAVATDGDTSSTLSPPGGENWTSIDVSDYSSEVTLGAWWKLAEASESASHAFTWTGGQQAYGWMMHFTGQNTTLPIHTSSTTGGTSSSPTSPSVTTLEDNCIILRLGAFDDDDITVDSPGLSGHTAITMDESSASSSGTVSYEGFSEAKRTSDVYSVTIATPSGVSEGDLLIAAVAVDDDHEYNLSPPGGEGWNEIDVDDYNIYITLGVWWKLADASESSSHQFTWSGDGSQAYGWIMHFTGHATSPINTWAKYSGIDTSSPYHATSPSVTTTVANCLILRIGAFEDGDITIDDTGLDNGHTDITMDRSSTNFGNASGGAGYKQQASAGSSGSVSFDLTDSEEYCTLTLAIAPSTASPSSVSGGAGYVSQASAGSSGTSTFSLGSSNEAQTLTIAISPSLESGYSGIQP